MYLREAQSVFVRINPDIAFCFSAFVKLKPKNALLRILQRINANVRVMKTLFPN